MKFAEHLGAHITPEWRKQYIKYEEMKAMLYNAIEQAPSAEDADPDEILKRYLTKFDEQFFRFCYKELEKINTFFSEKLAEATRKYANLNSDLREALEDARGAKDGFWSNGKRKLLYKRNLPAKKIQELKLAFSEFYLSLVLLQNYQNLNFTGFRKILKKHDKLLSVNTGLQWHEEHVELSHFHVNKDISRLIVETESAVTRELEGGDRARAMKRLRVPPLGEQQNIWTTFKVGFFAGALVVLSVAVIISGLFHHRRDDWRIVFRLYRGPLLIVEFLFLWSINVYGWRSSGVNHVLIFELNPRSHLSEQHIMELAAVFGVVWALSVLSFLYSPALGVPAYVNPLILHVLMLAFLINPFKVFRHEARFWALRVLGRIFLSPFFYVSFADFFVADQINSLAPVFLDLQYFFCFYAKIDNWCESEDAQICMKNSYLLRPIMATLPSWFRLAQCLRRYRDTREAFPHLVNAAKYATTFFVIIFATLSMKYEESNPEITENPWFYAWLSASVISSGCTYVWDIKMDWGLFDSKAGDNKFLREEIVYSSTWFYYFAIVEDLILRFGWALSLSLTEMGYIHADLMVSILAPLEVFRRFVWNFFRLENEHLNNCGKFRAVRDISVAPMDSSDQITILRMMDNEDGVMNRNISKPTTKKQRQPFRVLLSVDSVDDLDN